MKRVARVSPPQAFRSDTVGVFGILALAGLLALATNEPGSLDDQVNRPVATIWAVTLLIAGVVGVATSYAPPTRGLIAAGAQVGCRVASAIACLAYAVAITAATAAGSGRYGLAVVFLGLAVMHALAARTIFLWLHRQRELVEVVLQAQARERDDGDSGG